MGRKKHEVSSTDDVVVDSRFEKVFVDPKFAKSRRRNVATGEIEHEAQLYEVLDHVKLDADIRAKAKALGEKEEFAWDAASTSDESLSEDEIIQKDFQDLREQLAAQAWAGESDDIVRDDTLTNRLAIMGLDWTNLTAADVYVLCHSSVSKAKETQLPNGDRKSSVIERVDIYVSNLGKLALAEEAEHGPSFEDLELMRKKAEELVALEGELSEATALAVRAYEKKRAMYYYAVVQCVSVETAEEIYEALDGMDADFAIDGIDVRYIPSHIDEFTSEPTSEAVALPRRYLAPVAFQSSNRHTRSELHWDESDQRRKKILTKRFTDSEMNDLDLQDYFAGSDSDQGDNQPDPSKIAAIRQLLLGSAPAVDTTAPEIEGTFKIRTDGSSRPEKVDEVSESECSDHEEESSQPTSHTKRSQVGGFALLLGESSHQNNNTGSSDPAPVLEAGGVSSSDDERTMASQTKVQTRRDKRKAKAKEAKLQHKKKKMQKLQENELIGDLKEDTRFAEMFTDPKHFVDCVEEQRRSKKSRHK